MAEIYDPDDPAYVTNPNRAKGVGVSILAKGPHWDSPDWRDLVAASAARTVLDRHIYRLIAARTRERIRILGPEVQEVIIRGDKTAWLVKFLARRGGRFEVVQHRIRYLRWLGVIASANTHGLVSVEYAGPREVKQQPYRKRSRHRQDGVPYEVESIASALPRVPTHNHTIESPATDMRDTGGPVRGLGHGPGDVPRLLPDAGNSGPRIHAISTGGGD